MNNNHTIAILGYNNHAITMQNIRHLRSNGCNDPVFLWDNGSNPEYASMVDGIENITCHRMEENCLVNPVWNKLFDMCPTRFLTLLNNDCFILSFNYFDQIIPHMMENDLTLTSAKTFRKKKLPSKMALGLWHRFQNSQSIKYLTNVRRQGWLMTIDLERLRALSGYHIPEYLKIWFGDDWIWYRVISAGLKCAVFTNRFALHLDFPVTTNSSIGEIIDSDKESLDKFGDWHRKYKSIIHCKTRFFSRYV